MGSDLLELTIEGSMNPITRDLDSGLILPRTLIVPRNSGIQTVYADIVHSIERAKRFKPPFREFAIQMAMADLKGLISISSEAGAFIREFNTVRSSVPIGANTGQPASYLDELMYEKYMGRKDFLKNNPKQKGSLFDL